MQDRSLQIAVIGLGPRALGALEALFAKLRTEPPRIYIDVFDPSPFPGAGPNFAPSEPRQCLLNIPFRDIAIRPPEGSHVGAFADWLDWPVAPDAFPPRADLGRYLEARWRDLEVRLRHAGITVRRLSTRGTALTRTTDGWQLEAAGARHGPYGEVLIAPGQPDVAPDDQLAEWQAHAKDNDVILAQAYPARELVVAATGWQGKQVAIRGLGLSTFDVLRGLTLAQGGRFDAAGYHSSGREPARILPFSLDGQPPYPKPETEAIDALFNPTEAETKAFETALASARSGDCALAIAELTQALIPPVARISGANAEEIAAWVAQEWQDPGAQNSDNAQECLERGIALASGEAKPDIGYTLGQVWRKWQDNWRAGFNPARLGPELAKRLDDFDEGLKRYSYGPPINAARELQALVEAGIVDLSCVKDPEIVLTPIGWTLRTGGAMAEVDVMVDAVLPAPDLDRLCDPLLIGLRRDRLLTPLHPKLAAATEPDGSLLDADRRPVPGLCALGRLALGSVTAVDSLHDCFGQSAHRWAEGVRKRWHL